MAEIPEFTTRPELAGTFGMVASTHWLASAVGMAVPYLSGAGNASGRGGRRRSSPSRSSSRTSTAPAARCP